MATAPRKKRHKHKDSNTLESIPVTNEESVFEPKTEESVVAAPTPSPKSAKPAEPIAITSAPEETMNSAVDTANKAKQPSRRGLILSLLATAVIGGVLAGGIFYSRTSLRTTNTDQETKPVPSPTPITTTTPTPSEPAAIDLSKYTVSVLNGSGVAGAAGSVSQLLQSEGFAEAETDNADSYDHTDTTVQLKEKTPKKVFDTIKGILDTEYNVVLGEVLDQDSEFDIIVTVGEKI